MRWKKDTYVKRNYTDKLTVKEQAINGITATY
jgi:hypothetical protein